MTAGTHAHHDADSGGRPEEASLITATFAFVVFATFIYFLTIGALIPTVPRYVADELGGGGLEVGISVGAFAVTAAAFRPWIGRLGDIRGRRILVMGGAAIAGVSIMAYPLATTVPLMVAARLVSGVGEAAVFTGAASAAQDLAPDHRRGEAASYFSVALYGGIAVGPLAGEALRRATDFQTVFLVFGACSLLAALVAAKIPVGKRTTGSMRLRGDGGDGPGLVHSSAILPGLILFLGLIPIVAFGAFLPLYGEQVGMDDIGPVLGVYAGLVLVVRIFGAKLPDVMGWRRGSSLALWGVMAGAGVIGFWASSIAVWLGAIALAIGMSLLFPALFMAVMGSAPEKERTHAIGSFSLFFDLSQGLGAAFVGGVVSLTSERGGFVAAATCAAVGIVVQRILAARIGTGLRSGTS